MVGDDNVPRLAVCGGKIKQHQKPEQQHLAIQSTEADRQRKNQMMCGPYNTQARVQQTFEMGSYDPVRKILFLNFVRTSLWVD